MQLPNIHIIAVICLTSLCFIIDINATDNSNTVFLEESYYFIEKTINIKDHATQLKSLQKITWTLLNTNVTKNKNNTIANQVKSLELTPWNKAAVRSNLHRLNLAKHQLLIITEPHKIHKRAAPLEFLGEIGHLLIGTPSPKQYRALNDLVTTLIEQGKEQGHVLHGLNHAQTIISSIITRIDEQTTQNTESTTHLKKIITLVQSNLLNKIDTNSHIIALIAATDTVIFKGLILQNMLKHSISSAKLGLLSPYSISPQELNAILNIKSTNVLLPPNSPQNQFFYENKLTHAQINADSMSTILRIPLYNHHVRYSMQNTYTYELDHPLRFTHIIMFEKDFRYLTNTDISSCTKNSLQKELICYKRKITINKKQRGKLFIHDLDLTHIFFQLNNDIQAQIICKHSNDIIDIPKTANISLHPDCSIIHSDFIVWKMDESPIKHLFSADTHAFEEIQKDILFLQSHKSNLSTEVALLNISINHLERTLFNNVSENFALKSDLLLLKTTQNKTRTALEQSDLTQAKIDSEHSQSQLISQTSDIVIIALLILGMAILSLIIYIIKKNMYTAHHENSDINTIFKRLSKLDAKLGCNTNTDIATP